MASFKSRIVGFIMKRIMHFDKPLEEIRSDFAKMSVKLKMNPGTSIEEVTADGVRCYLVKPDYGQSDEFIFYLHGGGYCLGLYDATKDFGIKLSELYGKNVLIVDYRVAPEYPFPAGIEDAIAAYKWLLKYEGNSEKIAIYAESAGCGLALNTLVHARDTGLALPACSAFATPFLDATMSSDSVTRNALVDPFYASDENLIVNHYTQGLDKTEPRVSPLFHDVHDLTPIMVHIAEKDMLCDDGYNLVDKLKKAGNDVSHRTFEGMWHVFHMQGINLLESRAALTDIGEFYRINMA